jgi:hypothetical protein
MGSFVALNDSAKIARNLTNADALRVASGNNDAFQQIAFGKHADQPVHVVKHADRADISRGHVFRGLLDGSRSLRRVRLTVANHVSDQHRLAS